MRNFKSLLYISVKLFLITLFCSCSGTEPDDITPDTIPFFRVNIDGELIEAPTPFIDIEDLGDGVTEAYSVVLSGFKGFSTEGLFITLLTVDEFPNVGHYESIGETNQDFDYLVGCSYTLDGSTFWTNGEPNTFAKLTINTGDFQPGSWISGNFSARLVQDSIGNTVNVTDGEFLIQLDD